MKRLTFPRSWKYTLPMMLCALVWSFSTLVAQDAPRPDLLREKANDIERKAVDLKNDGRHDEAKKLMMEVDELRANADRIQRGEPRGEPMRGMGPDRREGPVGQPEGMDFRQRMRHLQVAIDNLHAAGMHEPADRLAMDKERMMQEMRDRSEQGDRGPQKRGMQQKGGGDGLQKEVQMLRKEIQELRKALKEVNGRVDGMKKEIKR